MPKDIIQWSDDRIEQLKKLHARHWTASQIAAEMDYLTRNAVLGKIHRLGLSNSIPKVVREKEPPRPRIRVTRVNSNSTKMRAMPAIEADQYKLRCIEIISRGVTLLDLAEIDCRYPYGGFGDPITFCGHTKRDGSSYCSPHHFLTIGAGTSSERAASKISNSILEAA